MAQAPAKIDRQTTTPFLLRLFYKQGAFQRLDDFDASLPRLPTHLQIYTWQSCTLRELCTLLLSALPTQLPQPYAGARIAFRLIYPDQGSSRPGAPGRFISRDIGSVIVGARTKDKDLDMEDEGASVADALRQLDGDPDKTLGDAKFLIGDYVACAILPPLPDGGVPSAPPPVSAPLRGGPPSGPYGGGRGRENGFGGRGDFAYGRGGRGGGRFDDRRDEGRLGGGVPFGEWRRGEAPPDREGGYGRGRGRGGGGGDGGDWRGRGRGRW